MRWWPFPRSAQSKPQPDNFLLTDTQAEILFGPGSQDYSGAGPLGEHGALALSAVWRSVHVIADTLATLTLRTLKGRPNGSIKRVESIFDNPGGDDGPTPFEWKQTLFTHLLLHGNGFEFPIYNAAGAIVRIDLLHPLAVQIVRPTLEEYGDPAKMPVGGKWFDVSMLDGRLIRFDGRTITHIPAMSTDGLRGMSPLQVARNSLGTAAAGDRAAARTFSSGALMSGIVTPDGVDLEGSDVKKIREELNRNAVGWENAGGLAIVNRALKFQPWTMSAVDAQFLQSRQFSIEEIARWWGVHPSLLMQLDKQTSWGTGIEEQNRGLGRTVLQPWAQCAEQRNSRLLPDKKTYVEFDFASLERPSPKDEITLLLAQTGKPFLTVNEARKVRNLEPIPGGDVLEGAAPPPADPAAPPADPAPEVP